MTEIDRRPSTIAVVLATIAAFFAAASTSLAALEAAPFGFLGLLLVVAGMIRASRRLLAYGAGIQALGIAAGGVAAGGVEGLIVAAVAALTAWDVGDHGISLGESVGRDGRSTRNLLVHAAGTVLTGGLAAGVAYGTYVAATGGQPIAALVFLLMGAVVLASAFR